MGNSPPSNFDALEESIDAQIKAHLSEASNIIDDFWLSIKTEKQKRLARRSAALANGNDREALKFKSNVVAPRIEKISVGSKGVKAFKSTLTWSVYDDVGRLASAKSNKKGVQVSRFAKRVPKNSAKEFTLEGLLRYSVGWDAKYIIDTEMKLVVHREMIERLHRTKVHFRMTQKRIDRISIKLGDSYDKFNRTKNSAPSKDSTYQQESETNRAETV